MASSALALTWPTGSSAQEKAASATLTNNVAADVKQAASPPSAGLFNDWLRGENKAFESWDLGGQLRAREEHKEYFFTPGQAGQVDFRKVGGDPDNTYLLLRARVHLGYNTEWVGGFA